MAPFAQKRQLAHQTPEAKMGRPTLYREEYCERVIEEMSQGVSLTGFAGKIGVDKASIYEWMSVHRDFSNAVARARTARVLWWEQKLMRSRKGAETSASIFALRNADPSEWRDIRNVQHEHNVNLQSMTDEQLLAIAQGRGHDIRTIEHEPATQPLPSKRDSK